MKKLKSHFRFDKQERNGIFFLLLLMVVLQAIYFLLKTQNTDKISSLTWDSEIQKQVDSLKQLALIEKVPKIYPFNPNYITDYKGYTLGMSPKEIDRLLEFRKTGKFVNSASEFQQVTQISDSVLATFSPYFKFPDWVQSKKRSTTNINPKKETHSKQVVDLNLATQEELRRIYGIGEKLSARILKFRDRLGGFLVNEQLYDVYGLDSQTVEKVLEKFQVVNPPEIEKIKINTATVSEIAQLVYINRSLAQKIVRHREEKGLFNSLEELSVMFNDSKEKIDRIGLYLSFEKE